MRDTIIDDTTILTGIGCLWCWYPQLAYCSTHQGVMLNPIDGQQPGEIVEDIRSGTRKSSQVAKTPPTRRPLRPCACSPWLLEQIWKAGPIARTSGPQVQGQFGCHNTEVPLLCT